MNEIADKATVIADRLWNRMIQIYGRQWEANYGQMDGDAYPVWRDAIAEFTPQQIKRGLDALVKEGSDFPPNLVKFCRLCRTAPVAYHQPIARALPQPKGSFKQFRLMSAMTAATFGTEPKTIKYNRKFKDDWSAQNEKDLQALFAKYEGQELIESLELMTRTGLAI